MARALYERMEHCTVRVDAAQGGFGAGFFVSPGLILTCAHVVGDAAGVGDTFSIRWGDQKLSADLIAVQPSPFPAEGLVYPDLALLKTASTGSPCVYLLDDAEAGDRMYTFGFSQDYPDGDPATVEYEGMMAGPQKLLKLKAGQIVPGTSGGALLNVRTGGVCGVVKRSRDPASDLGGRAVPVEIVLRTFPQLAALQADYHAAHGEWLALRSPEQIAGSQPRPTTSRLSAWERQRIEQRIAQERRRLQWKEEEIEAVDLNLSTTTDNLAKTVQRRQRAILEAERAEFEAAIATFEVQLEAAGGH